MRPVISMAFSGADRLAGNPILDFADPPVPDAWIGAVRLTDIQGKGKGWVAMEPLDPGTLVLVERPLVSVWHDSEEPDNAQLVLAALALARSDAEVAGFLLSSVSPSHSEIADLAKPACLAAVLRGTRGEPLPSGWQARDVFRLAFVVQHNAHSLRPLLSKGPQGLGLFRNSLRFNHSCWPNCVRLDTEAGWLYHRTTRHVKAGEELTEAYVPPLTPPGLRREHLRQTYGFECRCPVCNERDDQKACLRACPGNRCHLRGCPHEGEYGGNGPCAECGCVPCGRDRRLVALYCPNAHEVDESAGHCEACSAALTTTARLVRAVRAALQAARSPTQTTEARLASIAAVLQDAALDTVVGPDNHLRLELLEHLAFLTQRLGVEGHSSVLERCLEIRTRVLPPNDPSLVPLLIALGRVEEAVRVHHISYGGGAEFMLARYPKSLTL